MWTVNDVLINPYPFYCIKRVWIDQNKKGMDQPRRHWRSTLYVFGRLFEQICQLPVMCGATTTNDAIKAFRYAQQRHLMHYVVKWVLTLSKFYPNFIEIKINFLICKVNGQWHQMHLFQAYLLTRYIRTYSCQFLQPKLGSAIILTKVLQGVSAIVGFHLVRSPAWYSMI